MFSEDIEGIVYFENVLELGGIITADCTDDAEDDGRPLCAVLVLGAQLLPVPKP